jgi:hypothetical protein
MPVTTVTLTPSALIAAGTTCVPGTPQRAVKDMRGRHGGVLTARILNGATGPGAQCVATVYVAHDSGSVPAAGAEGATWKWFQTLGGGGITANAATPMSMVIPPMCHFQVEFAGNTGQNVTVEAFFTEYTNLDTA